MQIQLIRNATLKIQYGGHTLLIDPDLANKHAREPLAGIANNPTAELPVPLEEVLEGIDAVLVSHLHQDHFDAVAQELLPKYLPLFCQPEDQAKIASSGFRDVHPVVDALEWQSIKIIRTPAQHGTGVWAERLAPVSGFVLQADSEPAVYWCGDTILYPAVNEVIENYSPEIIITHSGGALIGDSGAIIMDIEQTMALAHEAPDATIVAVHLEALDHCPVKRGDLSAAAQEAGIGGRIHIPDDGEVLRL